MKKNEVKNYVEQFFEEHMPFVVFIISVHVPCFMSFDSEPLWIKFWARKSNLVRSLVQLQ